MKKGITIFLSVAMIGLAAIGMSACGGNAKEIQSFSVNQETGELVVHYADNTSVNIGVVVGRDGQNGQDGADGQNGQDGENGQDGLTPYVGKNGNWYIGETDTGVQAQAQDGTDGINGLTPFIGENGDWYIGETDTGVQAQAQDGENGKDGLTPYIGGNGHWYIGDLDTGIRSAGQDGKDGLTPYIGGNGHWWIGTTDTKIVAEGVNGKDGKDAEQNLQGLAFYLKDDNTYAVGVGNAKLLSKVVVPATYNGLTVTEIVSQAFINCDHLRSIVLPSSITTIGESAFYGCGSLTAIYLPRSVKTVNSNAFNSCYLLSDIYYDGNQNDWSGMTVVLNGNDSFGRATAYYYSSVQPTEEGNYWHYDTDGTTVVKW